MSEVERASGPEAVRSLYRAMAAGDGGTPAVGRNDLGVRPVDLQPDADGIAQPGRGGMSVAPDDPMNLPIFRRPASLAGTGKKPVWAIPDATLGPNLIFRQDTATHGMVEPPSAMPWPQYIGALEATASKWELRHA